MTFPGAETAGRTALITGVAGQDGVYLAHLLRGQGYRVIGVTAPGSTTLAQVRAYLADIDLVEVDVRDSLAVREVINRHQPDEIYNLAARSSVGTSWRDAEAVAETNGMAVLRLLEALLRYRDDSGVAPRLYQASSSEIFGLALEQPQSERTPHHPRSPYGAAKSFAHHLTVNYRESYGLYACNGILFNHESPLRPDRFVTRKITQAVAEISLGRRNTVSLGNLEARRDWGAASDYVTAMWLMLQQETPADYVIATGVSSSIRDFVTLAFACIGIDDPWPYIARDPALMRPADVPQTWGDPTRAHDELGWSATTSLPTLVKSMVDADVERLSTGVVESPALLGW